MNFGYFKDLVTDLLTQSPPLPPYPHPQLKKLFNGKFSICLAALDNQS